MLAGRSADVLDDLFRRCFFRPVTGEHLRAVARIRKSRRMIGFVDMDVIDPDGKLVDVGRANYATLK